jgi:hypothetical protein
MPFWIRKAGSFIHRQLQVDQRPITITKDQATPLLASFVESEGAAIAEIALSQLFRVYPELMPVSTTATSGQVIKAADQLGSVLRNYGVLRERGGYLAPAGAMIEAGMQLRSQLTEPGVGSGAEPARFATLDEWADELAVINALRNKIEKRLRSVVVNFIRFSALQNPRDRSLGERIASVLSADRRSRLGPLTPDELIEKFNWSDLVGLIEREWPIFSPLFHDKAALTTNGRLVNDRFDAHAKDADKADLALYRRAVRWFEECLSKT